MAPTSVLCATLGLSGVSVSVTTMAVGEPSGELSAVCDAYRYIDFGHRLPNV